MMRLTYRCLYFQAEEEGLITMGITIDEESESIPTYFEEVRQLYHRVSSDVESWIE